jgi:hypothetical protein
MAAKEQPQQPAAEQPLLEDDDDFEEFPKESERI